MTIGKSPACARDLVDPEFEHQRHAEVMHRHPDHVLVRPIKFVSSTSEIASSSFCCGVRASSGV